MSSSFSGGSAAHRAYSSVTLTQLYTFSPWSRSKSFSVMPYVGFPGLTLTPIPENPLLDSMLQEDGVEPGGEHEVWLKEESASVATWNPQAMKKGALPNHWVTTTPRAELVSQDVEAAKDSTASAKGSTASSRPCSMDLSSKQSFLSKDDDALTAKEQRQSHLMKLLLFALCGVVIVAGILIWIFSPAFV